MSFHHAKKRKLRPTQLYKDVHIDSDFSDTKNPGEFTIQLQTSLHNVNSMGLHSLTMPSVIVPIQNKTIRWTMDEEKEARTVNGYPSIFTASPGPTTCTVFETTVTGNFSNESHYRSIGRQMSQAMHEQGPSIAILNENAGIGATNLWRGTPNFVDTATANDPLTGEAGHEPLNQFDSFTPVNVSAVEEYTFVPRIYVRINKDSKTEILSNFKLRLRPAAYNGEPDQVADNSLLKTMGFTIEDSNGNLIDDPGVRSYRPQARLSPTGSGETILIDEGTYIDGQAYFYMLTSENTANFQPHRYLFVTTPNIFIHSQQSNPIIYGHNVLAKVPVTNYGTVPTFTKDAFTDHFVDTNDISSIYIKIIDEDGNVPDFQNIGGLSMHLRIWYSGQ